MKKGFTLIELLVVIAIIAVLATIVVISLDVINARGANSAVQANLSQIRSESLLYHETNGSFVGLCEADVDPFRINDQLTEACFRTGAGATCKCFADVNSWVVTVPLRSSTDGYAWCVDSANFGAGIQLSRFNAITNANTLCQ